MARFKDRDQHFFSLELSSFTWAVMYIASLGALLFGLFLLLSLFRISSTAFHCYGNVDHIPYHRVGLLLGTSPQQAPGVPNAYFTARIEAAALLYKKHKIDYILASGDNRALSYNEPREMRRALIKAGVPADRIVMDFAGIRTLDSILRARSVFMLQDLTVISQGFHNERALFIAEHNGLNADGYNASEPDDTLAVMKVRLREFFARIKCILDVYLLETEPHFYGSPVKIGNAQMPVTPSNKPRHATSKPKAISDSAATLKQAAEKELARQRELEQRAAEEARLAAKHAEGIRELDEAYQRDGDFADQNAMAQSEQMSDDAQRQALQDAADTARDSIRESPEDGHSSSPRSYGDPWDN